MKETAVAIAAPESLVIEVEPQKKSRALMLRIQTLDRELSFHVHLVKRLINMAESLGMTPLQLETLQRNARADTR